MFLTELLPQEKKAFLELAHLVASIDGAMTTSEEVFLEDYKREMQLEEEYSIQNWSIERILMEFQSERSKQIALTEILGIVFTDGILSNEERKSIELIKKHFGYQRDQFESYRDWIESIKELSREQYRPSG